MEWLLSDGFIVEARLDSIFGGFHTQVSIMFDDGYYLGEVVLVIRLRSEITACTNMSAV